MEIDSLIIQEYQWIFRQAKRYCINRMDAEDLTGEVILKILNNRKSYNPDRPFRPWCRTIMVNTYITLYNHRNIIQFTDESDAVNSVSSYQATDTLTMHEYCSRIRCCRKQSCTVECVLLYAKGYSYNEISKLYKVSEGTVKSRISYGREILRKAFDIQIVK